MTDRTAPRAKAAHVWDKHPDEFYTEPKWCSSRLFDVEDFTGGILDPCCGRGNILDSADDHRLAAVGFDLVARSPLTRDTPVDFLSESFPAEIVMPKIGEVRHIVANPPFDLGREFALRALGLIGDGAKVAMIMPTRRLNAAGEWLARTPVKRILYLTPRPSMPPGEEFERLLALGKQPSGGTQDFAWCVWQRGYVGPRTVDWLHRDKGKGTA